MNVDATWTLANPVIKVGGEASSLSDLGSENILK
jgi:hypothetical protein